MNKHEAIKKVEQMGEYERFVNESIPKLSVLNILNQLDEPQKVKVPQFVADVIEGAREESAELEKAFQFAWWSEIDEFSKWYEKKSNRDVFARAWLDGYEVEKEKQYRVRFKGFNRRYIFLKYDQYDKTWFVGGKLNFEFYRAEHTQKQLEEADFGWVFNCPGVEVEEVTE